MKKKVTFIIGIKEQDEGFLAKLLIEKGNDK